MKTKTRWIVADLSPEANRIVAKELCENCSESEIGNFRCILGQNHKGYFVPNYAFVANLKRLAKREGSGIKFSLFKQENSRFIPVNFLIYLKKAK